MPAASRAFGGRRQRGQGRGQAVKDAAMAFFILRWNFVSGSIFLHLGGRVSLAEIRRRLLVPEAGRSPPCGCDDQSSVEEESLEFRGDHLGLGDYLLMVPRSMTKTGLTGEESFNFLFHERRLKRLKALPKALQR
ncbi:MAG: hypothetical protein MZV70_58845 [Desulfobacterales bacterium]|nr:hypothetical protein [Desulfobacterales bacterium]